MLSIVLYLESDFVIYKPTSKDIQNLPLDFQQQILQQQHLPQLLQFRYNHTEDRKMSSYFTIDDNQITVSNPIKPSRINFHTTIIIDNKLIYPQINTNSLIIVGLAAVSIQHNSMQVNTKTENVENIEQAYIKLPQNVISLQEVQHLIHVQQENDATRKQDSTQERVIIVTTATKICALSLNWECTKLMRIYDCFYLNYQPFVPIDFEENANDKSVGLILNQQSMVIKGEHIILLIAGYDEAHKIVVNSYLVNINCKEDKKNPTKDDQQNERNQQNKSALSLLSQCRLEMHGQVKNHYDFSFTVCCPQARTPTVVVYQIFHEKGQPVSVYTYNLSGMTDVKHPESHSLKPEELVHKLGCMHNYLHIKTVHQYEGQLYVCYSRYVPFSKNKQQDQTVGRVSNVISHLWVYNLSVGYTKNIIDLDGPLFDVAVLESRQKLMREQSLLLITKRNQGTYQCTYVKMESSSYHPTFSVNLKSLPVCLTSPDYIISLAKPNYSRDAIQYQKQSKQRHPYLMLSHKINKQTLYCKMWEMVGKMGSQNILSQILSLL